MFSKRDSKVKKKRDLGQEGEEVACHYLRRLGFRVLTQNFRTRCGEIDIIAEKGGETYFIEVKARRNRRQGDPTEQLPPYRLRRFERMATAYAQRIGILDQKLHLSLIGIDFSSGEPSIRFLRDIID